MAYLSNNNKNKKKKKKNREYCIEVYISYDIL